MKKFVFILIIFFFLTKNIYAEIVLRCEMKEKYNKKTRIELEIDKSLEKVWIDGILFSIELFGDRTVIAEKSNNEMSMKIKLDRYDGHISITTSNPDYVINGNCQRYKKMF